MKTTPVISHTFAVFKTKRGLRWVAISSNGYQDREREFVSVKALTDDVARTDQDGRYGPLRWWHEGEPDPTSLDRPWGPGVDLGWCDFSAMSGPCLIESGTFANDQIGEAIAQKAPDLAVSLGFFHPLAEPDREGVFHHIRRFERSIAPKERVANPFTAFYVPNGEQPVNTTKKAQLKALLDTLPESDVDALIAQGVSRVQTAAKAAGVKLKASSDAATKLAALEAQITALKAELEMPPAEEVVEETTEETEVEEPTEEEGEYAADLRVDDFRALVKEAVMDAIKPIVSQMKMGEKMEGMLKMMGEEMKGYMASAKAPEPPVDLKPLADEIAAVKALLAEVIGDQPVIASGSDRTALGIGAVNEAAISRTDKATAATGINWIGEWARTGETA